MKNISFDNVSLQKISAGRKISLAQIALFVCKSVLDYGFSVWKKQREDKYAEYLEEDDE